jgi:hypothetical protein
MGSADALSASHRSLQKRNAYSRGVLTAGLQTVERAMEKISGAPILPKTQESIARMRRGVVVVAAAGRCFGQLSEIATPFLRRRCDRRVLEGEARGAERQSQVERKPRRCPQRGGVVPCAGSRGQRAVDAASSDMGEERAFRTMGVGGFLTLRLPRLSQHRTSQQRQGWSSIRQRGRGPRHHHRGGYHSKRATSSAGGSEGRNGCLVQDK